MVKILLLPMTKNTVKLQVGKTYWRGERVMWVFGQESCRTLQQRRNNSLQVNFNLSWSCHFCFSLFSYFSLAKDIPYRDYCKLLTDWLFHRCSVCVDWILHFFTLQVNVGEEDYQQTHDWGHKTKKDWLSTISCGLCHEKLAKQITPLS